MRGRNRSQDKRLMIASALMFTISLVLQVLARKVPGFGDWYARKVYRFIAENAGRLSGGVPFALLEAGTLLLILYAVYYVFAHYKEWEKILIRALFLVTSLFFLFTVDCGINYYRKPFSSYSGLEVRASSLEELKSLCFQLTDEVNLLCKEDLEEMDLNSIEKESVEAMKKLGETYPELAGYYPPPKPFLWSYFFSAQQLCGMYSPFTVEATYNRFIPDYNIPHTVCHELSHLRGFMREDEANFIGYLACIGSKNHAFHYSGYLTGWIYATNALAEADPKAYAQVCGMLHDKAWADLKYNNEFWRRYDGRTAQVSNRMNDTYLKLNSQTDGVGSYGRMVDLMLAYARSE